MAQRNTTRPVLQEPERAAIARLLEQASRACLDERIGPSLQGQLTGYLAAMLSDAAKTVRSSEPEAPALLDAATGRLARYRGQLATVSEMGVRS
ncbi:MAG TPA: hypothetical protein VIV12_30785 [Streptosporangiaceae bacterium]